MSRMRLIFDGGSVGVGIWGICGDASFGGGKIYDGTIQCFVPRYQDARLTSSFTASDGGFFALGSFNLLLLRERLVDIDSS